MSERFNVYATIGLILLYKGKVLLMKRCNTGYMDGKYALISGHLEGGESLKKAMVREAKEEINVDVKESDLNYACVIRRGDNNNYFNFYLSCQNFKGDIKNNEPEKCEEIKWFDLNALPQEMIPNDRKAIFNFVHNVSFEEYNF